MRALLVYCHPRDTSYNAAVRDLVLRKLDAAGCETRVLDLYGNDFDPCLSAAGLEGYENTITNRAGIEQDADLLLWCDTLIFVYPTWWYGLPARLKGWLDRVMVPGVAFHMPEADGATIRPGLTHITAMAVFTTCGASRWLTLFIGAPGKRTLLRGVRILCAKRCRTAFAAHYLMDSSTAESRAAHLARVDAKMDRFLGTKRARHKSMPA